MRVQTANIPCYVDHAAKNAERKSVIKGEAKATCTFVKLANSFCNIGSRLNMGFASQFRAVFKVNSIQCTLNCCFFAAINDSPIPPLRSLVYSTC